MAILLATWPNSEVKRSSPGHQAQPSLGKKVGPTLGEARAVTISEVLDYAKSVPLISDGLSEPYSPNHTSGLTTSQHVYRQLEMLACLHGGDYERLASFVLNHNVEPEKRIGPTDLSELLGPLCVGLNQGHWLVLSAVCAFHDSGKLSQAWGARGQICLDRVEWLAHDFDSETILRNNPNLLRPMGLTEAQEAIVLHLCRLHSLPGQFFFGEGNLTAYHSVAADRAWLKVARIQGILDVMSALNQSMVRPILDSHRKLRDLLDGATDSNLDNLTLQAAESEVPSAAPGFGVVAQQRLQKLTGLQPNTPQLSRIADSVGENTLKTFRITCEGPSSWYGTYIANALGTGLVRAFGTNPPIEEILAALIRVVSAAATVYDGPRQDWALSALQPALLIQSQPKAAKRLVNAANAFLTPDEAQDRLLKGGTDLRARRGDTGVALELT